MQFNELTFRDALYGDEFIERSHFLAAFSEAVDGSTERAVLAGVQIVRMGDNSLYIAESREDKSVYVAVLPASMPLVARGFTGYNEEAVEGARGLFARLGDMSVASSPAGAWAAYDRARTIVKKRLKAFLAQKHETPYHDLFRLALDIILEKLGLSFVQMKLVGGPSKGMYALAEVQGPDGRAFWMSEVSYGTCSFCDAYIAAMNYSKTAERLRALTSICLHSVQRLKVIPQPKTNMES